MMKRTGFLVVLLLVSWTNAQAQTTKGAPQAPQSPQSPQSPHKAWSVGTRPAMALTDGKVEKVDKERGEVVIDHGELPNLGMEAMTMGFAVADKRMLDRLKPGDKVRFNAEARNGEATVTYIESAR